MNQGRRQILIVEDEAAHVEAVRRSFDLAGDQTDIQSVHTLREYRERIATQPPDLALVDLNLPDGRAPEILTHPAADAPFPVLVMTAYGNEQTVLEVMKAGALDYVVKSPDAFAAMPQTVERALREWQLLKFKKQAEMGLMQLAAIVESSDDAIIGQDMNGIITSWNKGAEHLFGYTSNEIKETPVLRLIPADRKDEELHFLEKIKRGENIGHFRTLRHTKDGRTIDVSITVSPIKNADGQLIGVSKIMRDITERKQQEEKVQLSRNMLANILESVPQSVFWKDSRSVYLGCNGNFARIAGLASHEEIVGKSDFDLPWLRQEAEAYISDDRDVMNGTRARIRLVEPLQMIDGTRLWIETTKVPLVDTTGKIFGVLGVFEDVTARVRAEEELQKLRQAVEQSANTIVITDIQGKIEYVNPAFEESTGYLMAEAVGQSTRLLKSGEHDANFYHGLWTTIASGQIWRGELLNRCKDGSLFWEWSTISPVQNEIGEILHYIQIGEDITERKALEIKLTEALITAEAGNRAKSEFLSVMSHELRTPLNGVLGFTELLTYTALDDEQQSLADTVTKCGEHLLALIKDILDFSSMEAGALKIQAAPMAVAESADLSILAVRPAAVAKGLALRIETTQGVPDHITGDALRIRQILINLLGNAIKFTSEGSVVLRIASDPEGRFLEFSVEDTGIGMSSETMGILFKPFTQSDSTISRSFGGTGLGLAISKRLAEAMKGSITVTSTLGKGSTFTLRLPLELATVDLPAQ